MEICVKFTIISKAMKISMTKNLNTIAYTKREKCKFLREFLLFPLL